MLSNIDVTAGDVDIARDQVFTFGAPKAVLIKIDSKTNLGLPSAYNATPEELRLKREQERSVATHFGIDSDAYRDRHGKTHNGKHLYENEVRIRLDLLVADLLAAGYKLTRAVWSQKPDSKGRKPDPTQQFIFALEGEAIELTEKVKTFLASVYVDGFHLWCNPKMAADGTAFRLDTLNGFSGQEPKYVDESPGFRLRFSAPESGQSGYDIEE
jgi:hypothetical protein